MIREDEDEWYPVGPLRRGNKDHTEFITRDSGKRLEYPTGMRRDTDSGKARFDLVMPEGLPYHEQMLTRWAGLMARGAEKYGERNWELAATPDERRRFRGSALRHLLQWYHGVDDGEDHAAAVMFNMQAAEYVAWRLRETDLG